VAQECERCKVIDMEIQAGVDRLTEAIGFYREYAEHGKTQEQRTLCAGKREGAILGRTYLEIARSRADMVFRHLGGEKKERGE
jgi:hypothetical protein